MNSLKVNNNKDIITINDKINRVSNNYVWKNNWKIHYEETINDINNKNPPLLLIPGFGVGTFHFHRNFEV